MNRNQNKICEMSKNILSRDLTDNRNVDATFYL